MSKKEKIIIVFFVLFSIAAGALFLYKCNFVEVEVINDNSSEASAIQEQEATTSAIVGSIEENKKDNPTTSEIIVSEDDIAQKTLILEKADQIKGVYINGYAAVSQNLNFKNIKNLLDTTELNAIVIDIKESEGPYLPNAMKKTIEALHKDNVWVIARICVFRDSSLIKQNPQWYLKKNFTSTNGTTTLELWKDSGGGYWLDPASPEVLEYIANFSKKAIDFGFDELQFDYVRFPSDGNIKDIVFPYYSTSTQTKYEVMKSFFVGLSESLRSYSYKTVLSVDLFGYIAGQYQSAEIGQRISDAAGNFDYLSFMLYPSHFYGGFFAPYDSKRQLPSVYFPYATSTTATSTDDLVSSNPYQVVLRSILTASDYLSKLDSSTKIRPWLQDFNLKQDTNRGIFYDAEKVRAQIQAAEDAGLSGWLLWNPSNVYTQDALIAE